MYRTTVPVAIVMSDRRYAEAVTKRLAIAWKELKVRMELTGEKEAPTGEKGAFGASPAAVLTDGATFFFAAKRYEDAPLFVIAEPFETSRKNVTFLSPFAGERELGASILEALGWKRSIASAKNGLSIFLTSTAGGVGLSAVATSLARMIRSMRKGPVLYLSYEPYPAGQDFFRGPMNGKTLPDYLLRLLSPNVAALPDAYFREDVSGVRYFGASGMYNELLELEEKDSERFLSSLSDAMEEGTLLFDVPSPDARKMEPLLDMAHILVTVGDGSEEVSIRNEALLERVMERFSFFETVSVLNESRFGMRLSAAVREDEIVLPYDPQSIEQRRISLEKGFGSGVMELAERVETIRRSEFDRRSVGRCAAEDEPGQRASFR